jgi:hypothetical protein
MIGVFFYLLEINSLVQQLGNPNWHVRQDAYFKLEKTLKDTNGSKNYDVLLAVKRGRQSSDLEISKRSQLLYNNYKGLYFWEAGWFWVFLDSKTADWSGHKLSVVVKLEKFGCRVVSIKGAYPNTIQLSCQMPVGLDREVIERIKLMKSVIDILPTIDPDALP